MFTPSRSLPLLLLICAVILPAAVMAAPMCHTFQSLNTPTPSPLLYRCNSDVYKASACCNNGAAKRAYNCFVCANALAEVACAVNCATDLVVTGFNYNNSKPVLPGKAVISATQAKTLFTACQAYAWCGTQQQMTSECKFLALSVKTSGRTSRTTLSIGTMADTCVLVDDLNPVSFAENILGLAVHDDDTVGFFSPIRSVPYLPASGANSRFDSSAWSTWIACSAAMAIISYINY